MQQVPLQRLSRACLLFAPWEVKEAGEVLCLRFAVVLPWCAWKLKLLDCQLHALLVELHAVPPQAPGLAADLSYLHCKAGNRQRIYYREGQSMVSHQFSCVCMYHAN